MDFSNKYGPPELLMKLAMGRVDSCPFESESIAKLKEETIAVLEEHGLRMERNPIEHSDIPIDYRYLGLLLKRRQITMLGWEISMQEFVWDREHDFREYRRQIHLRKGGDCRNRQTHSTILMN